MSYHETAALPESVDGTRNSFSGDPIESRQWTIKNLSPNVVEKARAAAKQNGMKINAWVAAALESAADSQLSKRSPQDDAFANDISSILAKIEEDRRENRLLIERIEKDISQIIKGQHGVFAEILARKVRNDGL